MNCILISEIERRLDAVTELCGPNRSCMASLKGLLSQLPDLERGLCTIYHKKVSSARKEVIYRKEEGKTRMESYHQVSLKICSWFRFQQQSYLKNKLLRFCNALNSHSLMWRCILRCINLFFAIVHTSRVCGNNQSSGEGYKTPAVKLRGSYKQIGIFTSQKRFH